MGFWLDHLARKTRIPYPVFFCLLTLSLYLLGIPVMVSTDNFFLFLVEPRWIALAVYGAFSVISLVFIYRKFLVSLERIQPLVSSEEAFQRLQERALHYLTHWVYWIIVLFWIVLNLLIFVFPASGGWAWYGSYNQPFLVAAYYQLAMVPANIFGGMFMFVVPIGLTLAYREICVNTPFNQDQLLSEWMSPFDGFRNLITVALLAAGISAIFVLLLWTVVPSLAPYISILIIVVPTLVLPHYYFHAFFSRARSTHLHSIRQELIKVSRDQEQDASQRTLILLEEARIERKQTWLIDIVTIVEILIVALMHVLLVELLTLLFHI